MKSTELRGYLTGLILGDGHIEKGVRKRGFRIKSTNLDFIDKIETELNESTPFTINVCYHAESFRDGVHRKPYKELAIKSHPYFVKKYNYFYDDRGNRRITNESLAWLTLPGLANWYMSDGYIVRVGIRSGEIKDRRVELCTDRYSHTDVKKIAEYFSDYFGFDVRLVKRKEGVYRIRFSLKSAQYFLLMISPYVTESFKYKLNLCYDYQPIWMCDEYFTLMQAVA